MRYAEELRSTSGAREVEQDVKERIRLAELDLAQANEFVKGVVTISAGIRTSAFTVWLALLGFAVQQRLSFLSLLAMAVVAVFTVADGYHGWLYGQAIRHVGRIERLLSDYYRAVGRRIDDEEAWLDFRATLRTAEFGLYRSMSAKFRLRDLRYSRPAIFYRVAYPVLAVLAVVVWALVQWNVVTAPSSPPSTNVVVQRAP